jgi:hypothetical protein
MSFKSLLNFENLKTIRTLSILILNKSRDKIKRRLIDVLLVAFETLHLINNNFLKKESLIAKLLKLIRSKRRSKIFYHIIVKHIDRYTIKFLDAFDVARLKIVCVKFKISFALQLSIYLNDK